MILPRSLAVFDFHAGKALLAAVIAALVSAAVKLGTLASKFPVAGLFTCRTTFL
jgi:hypothetical protein